MVSSDELTFLLQKLRRHTMKFEIEQNDFMSKLGKVNKFISDKKNQLCILDVTDTGISLSTFNGTTTIRMKASTDDVKSLKITETGSVCLSTGMLFQSIKSLPKIWVKDSYEPITFNSWGAEVKKLRLSVTKSHVDLVVVKDECIPKTPDFENTKEIKIPRKYLFAAINQVAYATSTDESRPILTGVQLRFKKGTLLADGTDSHQLAHAELEGAYHPADIDKTVILSAKELKTIATSFESVTDEFAPFTIKFEAKDTSEDGMVQILDKNTDLTLRQIIGGYPDMDKLVGLTKEFRTFVTFDYYSLLNTVKHMATMSNLDPHRKVLLHIDPEKGVTSAESSSDLGIIKEDISFREIKGEALDIYVSQIYFLNLLKAYSGSAQITFGFNGELRPAFVKSEANSDNINPASSDISNDITSIQMLSPIQVH